MEILSLHNSRIIFGNYFYEELSNYIRIKGHSSVFILTDNHTNEFCLPKLLQNLAIDNVIEIIEIDAGEAYKTINTCEEVWQAMTDLGADRKTLLITLGGGVITDLGGFVAATFKRGIDCVNVPTSLLAMVDASVGGKTAVDFNVYKNLIGVFSVPKLVGIDTDFLDSLPREEWLSGWAEMLKHGLITDYTYWEELTDLDKITDRNINKLIYRSVEIKNNIVLKDFTEQNLRKTLNFGHTVGHAIESSFLNKNTPIKHGYAIAEGMIVEAYISWKKSLINEDYFKEVQSKIRAIYPKIDFTASDKQQIIQLIAHDKKNINGKIYFVLLNGKSKSVYNQLVSESEIHEALDFYMNSELF